MHHLVIPNAILKRPFGSVTRSTMGIHRLASSLGKQLYCQGHLGRLVEAAFHGAVVLIARIVLSSLDHGNDDFRDQHYKPPAVSITFHPQGFGKLDCLT